MRKGEEENREEGYGRRGIWEKRENDEGEGI